ncbi:DNA polymerase IV [candidate division WWE3 bacterium]|nr:DNA polymerase IV [candidate division WWE3 bacterium]
MPERQERIVLHIDFDSFFASVEQQANPEIRGKPVGVTGSSTTRGVVCAASIEAKKRGVKTGTPLYKAKLICPDITIVKGDFTKYQHIHEKSLEIFNKFTDLVEPFSIDEAFLEITDTVKFFVSPENIASLIKEEFKRTLGPYITCSIGVAPNKLLAKLASDLKKPNGLFRITKENLQAVLNSIKLKDLCGIGTKVETRLNKLNIHTTEDLKKASVVDLQREFGTVRAEFLKNLSLGIDDGPVQPANLYRAAKSIGHQHTLSKNTKDETVVKSNTKRLADMVGRRLRKSAMMGKTVSIYLRDKNMLGYNGQTTLHNYTDDTQKIFRAAEKLLDFGKWKKAIDKEIRLIGITVSNLVPKTQTDYPLFADEQKTERLTSASDLINDKYGDFTLIHANTLTADTTKGKISSFLRYSKNPLGS